MTLKRIVIAGGGLAGLRAAEALRAEGFDGSLVMLSADTVLPYDRPPLSKQVLVGDMTADSAVLRSEQFYVDHAIELRLASPATGLHTSGHRVLTPNAEVPFDALVIATGSRARELPGTAGVAGVHTLRGLDDSRAVREAFSARPKVAVIGAGFIGAEVASSARALGLETTIIEAAPVPLGRAVGIEMGSLLGNLHRAHGSVLNCGVGVAGIHGNGRVEAVELTDGRRIAADLVIVGIGVLPNTEWLRGSGLRLRDGVECHATLCAGPPGIYAAGDVARWPNPLFGETMRCEQWTNAAEQGRHVARNILAGTTRAQPFAGSNYFWSDQYGVRVQYAGVTDADEVRVVSGSVDNHKFLALYRRGPRVIGALALNSAKELIKAKTRIEQRVSWEDALSELGTEPARTSVRA